MVPPINAALASRWIATGILDDIALAIRDENIARQKIAKSALGDAQVAADKCGSHIWMRMPPHWRAIDFVHHAGRSGISVVPGAAFAIGPTEPEALRLSLGVAPDRDALLQALKQLASLLSQPSAAAKAIV
jgi:DNA-binding transcriptional MocR family regulator